MGTSRRARSSQGLLTATFAAAAATLAILLTGLSGGSLPAGAAQPPVASTLMPAPRTAPSSTAAWSFFGPKSLEQPANSGAIRPVSGRITSVVVDPLDPQTLYAGSAGAGVWKSVDAGQTWSALMAQQASLAIGALAIDGTGQVIFAGTGEINGSDSQYGQGILKSTDGGATWTLLGQSLFAGQYVGGLAVDRTDASHVLAATSLGLYSSEDGGQTWTRNAQLASLMTPVGSGTPSGQAYEVHQDLVNPLDFIVSFGDDCTTEAGGLAVSLDGGTTWRVTYAAGQTGRIGVGVGPDQVAYAAVAACTGGMEVDKSIDGGGSWSALPAATPGLFNIFKADPDSDDPQAQGSYDNAVAVDPTNADDAVFGGVNVMTTTTGGASFTDAGHVYTGGFIHPDFHAFAFFAPDSFFVGNDGGMWSTTDMGGTGTQADYADLNATLETLQFTAGTALDLQHVLGGTQDNGSPGSFPGSGVPLPQMADYSGGDGGDTAIDPTPGSPIIYTEYTNLSIERHSLVDGSTTNVGPCPTPTATDPACSENRSFYAPYVMDPTNPQRLLAGAQRVYQSLDGGGPAGGAASWQPISPDLTRGGTDSLQSIAVGPGGGNTVFAASAQGRVSRTTDGATWDDVTGNLPPVTSAQEFGRFDFMSQVAFNPANPAEAWVTVSAANVGGVWHTVDAGDGGGTQWANIRGSGSGALPDAPVLSVAVDPSDPATVYAGTLYGAWVCTTCGGASPDPAWQPVGSGLPNVEVDRITFTSDHADLLAWTHGWGLWTLSLPPAPAASIAAAGGTPQSTAVGAAFPSPLQARVTGAGGLGVPGVAVTFTAPGSGASGTFPGGTLSVTVTTDATGKATAPTFTANGTAGTYAVTATAPGVSGSAGFALTNTSSPAPGPTPGGSTGGGGGKVQQAAFPGTGGTGTARAGTARTNGSLAFTGAELWITLAGVGLIGAGLALRPWRRRAGRPG